MVQEKAQAWAAASGLGSAEEKASGSDEGSERRKATATAALTVEPKATG